MNKTILAALAAVASAEQFRSGEIKSMESFLYGRFTAQIQASTHPGTVSSFFTYFDGPNWSKAGWNEIDVEIVPSIRENPFSMNIIGANQAQDHSYAPNFQPGNDWHTYVITWTPEYIAWSIDGREIRRTQGTPIEHF
jgi:endo-1,3-1,4-beta-glycanase ExoK